MTAAGFATLQSGRLRLRIRLSPNAASTEIVGAGERPGEGPALLVRVRARPVEGEANTALLLCLADATGLPKTALALEKGGRSRLKTVVARGAQGELAAALARLAALAAAAGGPQRTRATGGG